MHSDERVGDCHVELGANRDGLAHRERMNYPAVPAVLQESFRRGKEIHRAGPCPPSPVEKGAQAVQIAIRGMRDAVHVEEHDDLRGVEAGSFSRASEGEREVLQPGVQLSLKSVELDCGINGGQA